MRLKVNNNLYNDIVFKTMSIIFREDDPDNVLSVLTVLVDTEGVTERKVLLYEDVPKNKQDIFVDNILSTLLHRGYFDFDRLKRLHFFQTFMELGE